MFSNMMWIVTGASLIGTVLNIKRKRICFLIWFFTNAIWAIYDLSIGAYPQSVLFAIYWLLAVWGLLEWSGKKHI